MPAKTYTLAGLQAVGYQEMSLANSTAIAINSTCRAANVLDISVETQAARYRMDATAPTLTAGVLLAANSHFRFEGYNGTSLLRFQRTTGTAKVCIMAYKHNPGRS